MEKGEVADMGNVNKIKCGTAGSLLNSLLQSESGVSGAIAFILLFGIVFSIYSAIHLGYVPEWKREIEDSHMTNIWKDMTEVKSKIDRSTLLLMSTSVHDSKSTLLNVNTKISFHTGSPKVPLIDSTRSRGTISVNTDQYNMSLLPANGTEIPISYGTISYRSKNLYFIDQTFRYENGALILAQGEHATMKSFPAIRIFEDSPGNYTFLINAVEIQGSECILSSSSDCTVYLKNYSFQSVYNDEYTDNFTLKMETEYPGAWEAYFKEVMEGANLEESKNYTLNSENHSLNLLFPAENSTDRLKRIYVGKTTVNAEIGISLS